MTDQAELHALIALAEARDVAAFVDRVSGMHASDVSDVLVSLDDELRLAVIRALPPELASEALAEMEPEEHPEDVLAALSTKDAVNIIEELETDDAADLIGDLPRLTADILLAAVEDREEIRRLLEYDEESAGGIMTPALISVFDRVTAADAIDAIRRQSEDVGEFYQVYCTDENGVLVGLLPLRRLVRAPTGTLVRDMMEPVVVTASPEDDQEAVARSIARYNVPSIPVVDAGGHLLGRITFDDVIDVVEAEQTEDLLKFGGGSREEELGGSWREAVKLRLPWLYVNVLTASLSAFVVGVFRDSVEALWALAAMVPVIAAMGGTAGTQALAVTVRRVSLGLIPAERARSVVAKEVVVGLVNGLAVGAVVAIGSLLLEASWVFGAIVLIAMWGNLIVAGFFGSAVPLILERLGRDPAVASSAFVTAFTDVCGYILLFGLAARFVL